MGQEDNLQTTKAGNIFGQLFNTLWDANNLNNQIPMLL